MTTIAWDGEFMAADTLATDPWGLKETVENKVLVGNGCLVGGAGDHGNIIRWWRGAIEELGEAPTAGGLLEYGYPDYVKTDNDPAVLLVSREGAWRHSSGVFVPVSYPFFAIGSGRDYAMAVMSLGHNAEKAVWVASNFDNNTGGGIKTWTIPTPIATSFIRPMSDVIFNAPEGLQ